MIVKPIEIPTPDGVADGYAVYPSEEGQFPAVLFYMDGIGLRPTLVELAKELAARGYYVLLPNMFYRAGKAPVVEYGKLLAGVDTDRVRAKLMELVQSMTPESNERDARAFLAFIDAQPRVKPGKIAVTGYCMGGALALRTAAFLADRVAAAASFHGGNLATDKPASPHLLAGKIQAEVYVGHAKDDPSCPAEQQARLEQAFDAAGVKHQTEVYEAAHAWTMPDVPWAKNDEARAKAWSRLYELLDRTFK